MTPEQALEKARVARRNSYEESVWNELQRSIHMSDCRCELRKGMTLDSLRELGAGCTSDRFVCPLLDKYRRLLGA